MRLNRWVIGMYNKLYIHPAGLMCLNRWVISVYIQRAGKEGTDRRKDCGMWHRHNATPVTVEWRVRKCKCHDVNKGQFICSMQREVVRLVCHWVESVCSVGSGCERLRD